MDFQLLADLVIAVILLGALAAGQRGTWIYGNVHREIVADKDRQIERLEKRIAEAKEETRNAQTLYQSLITDLLEIARQTAQVVETTTQRGRR